ncbi:hypothetical protein [Mesorhizobium sp. Root172]|uniref:hypothetical protein n=1 Tax=Mesorhizobium sp. Root172 TaxID=1736481 RepID=UPI0006FE9EC9|nr:hypothetical protein [Mesorhizobium sp. Root172]KRB22662.1 hypothetical protein ASE05_15875 [Mesorhizobium sp. Root172]
MTPPKHRTPASKGFTDVQKVELAAIVDEAVKRAMAPAIRAELKDAGLRLDGDVNQMAAGADFMFLRRMRTIFEGASAKIGGAIILAVVSGIVWLLVIGSQAFFSKP